MASFERSCIRCGTAFTAKSRRGEYCSASCRAMASKERARAGSLERAKVMSLPGAAEWGNVFRGDARRLEIELPVAVRVWLLP